ncbi:hypothetical protein B9L23_07135 [Parageobacillus galactosidasius]|uniref:Integrase n=2 Tax=Parageobacillus galactosidasius TaxID=883812 RepID=A0A226QSS7_9BACL|nr:hypothetical protein B9L23_07135 [Parageobacillus galactosidasius]
MRDKMLEVIHNNLSLQTSLEEVKNLIEQSKSDNTKKAYQTDWKHFEDWCLRNNVQSMPAKVETILLYLNELSKQYKYSTIRRKLSSISQAHEIKGALNPTRHYYVLKLMQGIAKQKGTKQEAKKAIILDDIKKMIDVIDTTKLIGKRDKALLLVGFALASRRSELVAVDLEDITFTSQGMDIAIKQKKTNEVIMKSVVRIDSEYCPVRALKDWIEAAGIKEGAIFRTIDRHGNIKDRTKDKTVARVVKKYAELAGLNPNDYAGHSLRSGLATSAAQEGMNDTSIMKQTGHKTRSMVDRYVQEGNRYKNNASSILRNLG